MKPAEEAIEAIVAGWRVLADILAKGGDSPQVRLLLSDATWAFQQKDYQVATRIAAEASGLWR